MIIRPRRRRRLALIIAMIIVMIVIVRRSRGWLRGRLLHGLNNGGMASSQRQRSSAGEEEQGKRFGSCHRSALRLARENYGLNHKMQEPSRTAGSPKSCAHFKRLAQAVSD